MKKKKKINDMAGGYKDSAILLNSLRAGIFEALAEDWKTPHEIAVQCELDPRATDIVIHALAAAGILIKEGDRFSLEAPARPFLLGDSPTTLKSILGHNLFMMRGWAYLDQVMKTGEPIKNQERSKAQTRDFICGMENVSRISSLEVAARIDFKSDRRLLDLGGGPGTAAITFAKANPELECVVFDLEDPVGIAREEIEKAKLNHQVTTVTGDFHTDDLGSNFDVVYLSNIIHMLDSEETLALLRKCRSALKSDGRLLLKDFFLDDSRLAPAPLAQFSVNMLVNTKGGKTYTRSEIFFLLNTTGFSNYDVIDVGTNSQVITCISSTQ